MSGLPEVVVMAKARNVIVGVGCLLVVLGVLIVILAVAGMQGPALGKKLVVAIRLDRPIVERVADDPFSALMGGQPIGLRDLRASLVRAATDDRVVGVRLRIDRYLGGVGTAQEIRSLLGTVRAAGKWTKGYLDTAGEYAPGNFDYLVAAGCDEVSLDPMGDVNLIGLSIQFPFLRGTLDKLGIRPEFPGIGDFKDARFQYTHRDFTAAQRDMMQWLGESWTDQLVDGVATSRGLELDHVRYLIDRGPYLGAEAAEAGLVDHLEDWTAFAERVARESGDAQVVGYRTYLRRAGSVASRYKIAVVTATGTILRGASGTDLNPLFGGAIMGSDTIARALRRARTTAGVRAVVLRIDSPGGTPLGSEIIRREVARTAEKLPVVVSIANVGASGGYWIACDAQRIVANPGAAVGSIGVLAGHLNMGPFWEDKLGVTFGQMQFGANANLYGDLEDWSDSQRAVIDRILERTYDHFLALVADGRDMTVDEVDAIGQGRVFTGSQGAANGLVDVLGDLEEALAQARDLADIPPGAPVHLLDFPKVVPWWQQLLGRGSHDDEAVRELLSVLEEWWRTGALRTPGPVWMPPISVQ